MALAAYDAGDDVLHRAHMACLVPCEKLFGPTGCQIHASTINDDDPDGRFRLGTDLRFVNSARPWDTRWSNHCTLDDSV